MGQAILLGLIEGVTEYLPVSSTGHLAVAQRAMDIGQAPEEKDAADSYAIAIQFGAILAVLASTGAASSAWSKAWPARTPKADGSPSRS